MSSPASGSFTFKFGGNQVVVYLVLTTEKATGLKTQTILSSDPNARVNVYSIDGRIIRSNVPCNQATVGLPNGIYIIDGQKITINK